jgi:iron complex transport system substrate-binding protein
MRWVLAFLVVGACTHAPAIPPGKIVSNNPCIDAILAEIADPAQIGAVSAWSHDPASGSAPLTWARRFPAVGTSAEELIAARPSLVLTGNLAISGTNTALARAGIRVVSVGVPATIAESRDQVMAIATMIGRETQGRALVARIDAATQPVRGRPRAIIWQASGFVPGAGTIQDQLLQRAGYVNASAHYGLKQWDVLPLETVVRDPPDVIFTPVAADGEAERGLAARQMVLRHLAGKVRVVGFPEKLLFCAGPGVIETMRVLKAEGLR